MIGLTGAHRVGKSTVAKLFAQSTGFEFIESRAGEIFKQFGMEVGEQITFNKRMKIQNAILVDHTLQLEDCNRRKVNFITDRTPLDFLAYTMLSLSCDSTESQSDELMDYRGRCYDSLLQNYGICVLIQPGIQYLPAEGKPAPSLAYQETMNDLILSYAANDENATPTYRIERYVIDLNMRVKSVGKMWDNYSENCARAVQQSVIH